MPSMIWLPISAVAAAAAMGWCSLAQAEPTAAPRSLVWRADPSTTPQEPVNPEPPKPRHDAAQAAEDGRLLPFTQGAVLPGGVVDARSLAGYDGVTRSARVRAGAEAKLFSFLALRLDYEHGPSNGNDDRVALGAHVGVLRQAAHGIDASFGVSYDPKDFREEGNWVGAVMLGRRFGALGLFANVMFGTDSEGDDQSLELRLGGLARMTRAVQLGWDARGRFNVSNDEKRKRAQAVDYEVQFGPTASWAFGPIALLATAGPSVLRLSEPAFQMEAQSHSRIGLMGLAGAGGAF